MYVNKESQINGAGGIPVYDINRTRETGKIFPFVVSGSDKVSFRSQKFQPMVQNYSSDHFNISKYARENESSVINAFYGETFTTCRLHLYRSKH